MNKKLAHIATRRTRLIATAAQQRAAFTHTIKPLHSSFALADQGIALVRAAKQYSTLATVAVTLLGLLQTTRTGKWLQRGWAASFVMRNIRRWLSKS